MKDFIDDDKMKKQNSQQYNLTTLATNFKSTITTATTIVERNYMHIKKAENKTKRNLDI